MENNDESYFTKEEEEEIWKNIFTATRANDRKRRKRKLIFFSGISAIIVFVTFGVYLFQKPSIYTAGSNDIQIVLSDNTEVTLLKGAELTEKNFPSDTREVYLQGDAIFKVSKSKEHPFIVHGNGYETKVLGTVFKVSQQGETFSVDLYEGKVLVYKTEKPNESFELEPEETFTNMGVAQAVKIAKISKSVESNKLASLSFNECSLDKVAQVIEKTYNIKLMIPNSAEDAKITISSQNSTAEVYMELLAFQLNLNLIQINDKTFQLE